MNAPNTGFFLRFLLTSYSAIFFFAAGLGFAISHSSNLKQKEFMIIFCLITAMLSLSLKSEPSQGRLMIALIWTSLLFSGFRFGKKILKH